MYCVWRNIVRIQGSKDFRKALERNLFLTCQFKDAQVKMPALSPTMTTGTIVKWEKKEGDFVAAGDVLCEIQTDKAIVAMEIDDEGILAKILVPENTADISVGRLIALIVDEGKDWKNVVVPSNFGETPATPLSESAKSTASHGAPSDEVLDYIAVHRLVPKLHASHMDPSVVPVSKVSPKLEISVSAPKDSWALPPARIGKFEDKPVSKGRKDKAEELRSSKFYIPHAYNRILINLNEVQSTIESLGQSSSKIACRDFVLKACAVSLREVPEMNVYFDNDTSKFVLSTDIALYSDNSELFLTPVIRQIDRLNVEQISYAFNDIFTKLRANDFSHLDLNPSSFGFVDGSEAGLTELTTVVKNPQTAVLCLGAPMKEIDLRLNTCRTCLATLVYDNRAIDDQTASKFLQSLKANIETCSRSLLGLTGENKFSSNNYIS